MKRIEIIVNDNGESTMNLYNSQNAVIMSVCLSEEMSARFINLSKESVMALIDDDNKEEKETENIVPPNLGKYKRRRGTDECMQEYLAIARLYKENSKTGYVVSGMLERYPELFGNRSSKFCSNFYYRWKRLVGLLDSSSELNKFIAQRNYEIKKEDLLSVSEKFNISVEDLQEKVFLLRRLSGIDL